MGTIIEDIDEASKWIATALSKSGYKADFTPASLWDIDRFFDEHSKNGKVTPGGLLSEQLGSRLFAIGSYIGEVIRKKKSGRWVGNDSDPQGEINVELQLPDGTTCWPVQRVMKRLKNGSEDGIAVYGHGLGLDVGPKPREAKKTLWWKFVKKQKKLLFILVVIVIAGLWYDVDVCRYTSESIYTVRFLGIPIKRTKDAGYRPWLEKEIGLTVGSDFVHFLSAPLFLPAASTPPGNWLALRRAKQVYDDLPTKREEVRYVLLRLQTRVPPLLDGRDRTDLDMISGVPSDEGMKNE